MNPIYRDLVLYSNDKNQGPCNLGEGEVLQGMICIPSVPANMKARIEGLEKAIDSNPKLRGPKRDLFFFSTIYLYSAIPLLLSERNLTVMGLVHNDGVGDYYHILNAVELIKTKFPDVNVSMLVSHVDHRLPNMVRQPLNSQIATIFCKADQPHEKAYPLLQNADYIIDMSQQVDDPGVENIVKAKLEKYRDIGEYGSMNRLPMGVKINNLGIIIKDKPSTTSLLCLKNELLKQILFGTMAPSGKDLENYLKIHESFIGYLKIGSYYQMGLIYTVAAYLKSSEKQVIDLMIPPVAMEYLDLEFLKGQGIAKIRVIKIKKEQVFEEEIVLAKEGKVLRIINPFPLGQEDFHTLVAYTNPLVGCTGDHSLSEVISFDRLPFYELRSIKSGFLKDIIKLSGRFGENPRYLQQYFQELFSLYDAEHDAVIQSLAGYDKSTEQPQSPKQEVLDHFKAKQPQITTSALKIANLLRQPELIEECLQFNRFVRTQCSFNPLLQNIVEKHFALISYPNLQKTEKEIEKKYLEGRITLKEALEQLLEGIDITLKD